MTVLKHHVGLTPERWSQFSILMQLGNVSADVGRMIKWRNSGNHVQSENAFERALELMYLTIIDPKNKKRLRELLLAREAIKDYFVCGGEELGTTGEWLDNYFFQFAYAAALERGR